VKTWISEHVNDSDNVIRKPLLFTEFGEISKDENFTGQKRDIFYQNVYDEIYFSGTHGGSGVGALFWQLLVEGMDALKDGYELILSEVPSTAHLIAAQSRKLKGVPRMLARSTADRNIDGS
jgi:mannan endo-1,4-beta-mannosidase